MLTKNQRTKTNNSVNLTQSGANKLAASLDMRKRVHLPGKYIVLFVILPLFIIAMSVSGLISKWYTFQGATALQYRESASGEKQAYFPLKELIVDLSPDRNERVSFLKVVPVIAIQEGEQDRAVKILEEQKPLITERITLFLRGLRASDFEKTDQLNRIKREMTRRVNLGAGDHVAIDVVLEQVVIQ